MNLWRNIGTGFFSNANCVLFSQHRRWTWSSGRGLVSKYVRQRMYLLHCSKWRPTCRIAPWGRGESGKAWRETAVCSFSEKGADDWVYKTGITSLRWDFKTLCNHTSPIRSRKAHPTISTPIFLNVCLNHVKYSGVTFKYQSQRMVQQSQCYPGLF